MHTSFVRSFVRLLTCAHPHRVHREDINYSMEGKLTTCIHLNSLRRGLVNFFNTFCATSNNQVYAIARYSSLHFNSNHWSLSLVDIPGVFFSCCRDVFFFVYEKYICRYSQFWLQFVLIVIIGGTCAGCSASLRMALLLEHIGLIRDHTISVTMKESDFGSCSTSVYTRAPSIAESNCLRLLHTKCSMWKLLVYLVK